MAHCLARMDSSREKRWSWQLTMVRWVIESMDTWELRGPGLVHHLASSDWVIALEKGIVAHQGTLEDIRSSGYDPAGSIASKPSAMSDSKESDPTTKSDQDVATKEKEEPMADDTEEDETTRTYNQFGLTPYRFFASHTGYHRVFISITIMTLWAAIRLGTQASIFIPFRPCFSNNTVSLFTGVFKGMVSIQRGSSRELVGWLRWILYRRSVYRVGQWADTLSLCLPFILPPAFLVSGSILSL